MITAGLFGLGGMEILILLLLAAMFFGAPLIVLLIVLGRRSGPTPSDYAALAAENQRLRAELDRLKQRPV
ncbi:MAG TPA: hypothetical protein VGF55_15785 [Gemmataceae bacterium]